MKSVLIYAGTTEGRSLAECLSASGIPSIVSVATEYGQMVMEPHPLIDLHMGRLSVEEMTTLAEQAIAVVDATHPFATLVSENIRASLVGKEIPYFRMARDLSLADTGNLCYFASAEECVNALRKTSGKVLLTTGSKELSTFAEDSALRERLVARVLPGMESLALCYEAGLEGKQIIAMQGPFTEEMNLAVIRQYGIQVMVTKESGKVGGVDEKLLAAQAAGIACYVIAAPKEQENTYDLPGICKALEPLVGPVRGSLEISLCGIGMGNPDTMTLAVQKEIANADYLFGASRMIEGYQAKKKNYPFYLEKDIVPVLKELQEQPGLHRIVILFSGDSGFYSGTQKLYQALMLLPLAQVTVYPGISSMSALSAKLGISYQDAAIVSTHGISEAAWKRQMQEAVEGHEKTFFLTSGLMDLKAVAGLFLGRKNIHIYVGYHLSYEDEKVMCLVPEEVQDLSQDGLYVGMIVKESLCQD